LIIADFIGGPYSGETRALEAAVHVYQLEYLSAEMMSEALVSDPDDPLLPVSDIVIYRRESEMKARANDGTRIYRYNYEGVLRGEDPWATEK